MNSYSRTVVSGLRLAYSLLQKMSLQSFRARAVTYSEKAAANFRPTFRVCLLVQQQRWTMRAIIVRWQTGNVLNVYADLARVRDSLDRLGHRFVSISKEKDGPS
jgi:hypothetical protein